MFSKSSSLDSQWEADGFEPVVTVVSADSVGHLTPVEEDVAGGWLRHVGR
jgi:hypothetical protein